VGEPINWGESNLRDCPLVLTRKRCKGSHVIFILVNYGAP